MTRLFVLLALLAAGCQKPSDEPDTKRMPKPAPAPEPEIPAGLNITVSIDGKDAEALTGERLRAITPDFADGERRAWDLVKLIGEPASRPNSKLGFAAERGPEVVMDPSRSPEDPIPVLLVSRRGDVVATTLDPKAPFPEYHGRGGRLGRRGDPIPRVEGVKRIRIFVESTKGRSETESK